MLNDDPFVPNENFHVANHYWLPTIIIQKVMKKDLKTQRHEIKTDWKTEKDRERARIKTFHKQK